MKEVTAMANEQNLVRNEDRTPSQRRENARKAGKASAAKRAERKTFREGLLLLLNEPMQDKNGNPTDKTPQDAIIAALVKRAANGDTRAFEMIRDTIGEKPVQDVKVSTGDFSALDDAFKGMKNDPR